MDLFHRTLNSTTTGQSTGAGAIIRALLLFFSTAFCGFGFYASFELGPISVFHLGYGALGVWLASKVIGQLRNAAPRKRGWAWLLALGVACLLTAAMLLKPGNGSIDREFRAMAMGAMGVMLLAGGLSLALNPKQDQPRRAVTLTLATLAFLGLPLVVWLVATGGSHMPWRAGTRQDNPPWRQVDDPGRSRIPAIPARGIKR